MVVLPAGREQELLRNHLKYVRPVSESAQQERHVRNISSAHIKKPPSVSSEGGFKKTFKPDETYRTSDA
jgi:hypothetical protein